MTKLYIYSYLYILLPCRALEYRLLTFVKVFWQKCDKTMKRLTKDLRDKLPKYVVDLLESEDVVKLLTQFPGARLLDAKEKSQYKKKR